MKQYLDLIQYILDKGEDKEDRTGTGTRSIFGYQMRFDLQKGFPLITTKRVHLPSIIYELLWFLKGDTNIQYLVKNNIKIWNKWPYKKYKNSVEYKGEDIKKFSESIKNNDDFANKWGNLGPVYGKQWRDFLGVDQITDVIKQIRDNPDGRRHLVVAYNPAQVKYMALPPCHSLFQFYVSNGNLSCQLYQRSADVFIGVPFNIASYALLTMMVAQVTGLNVGDFVHTFGDVHIYSNHIKQVKLQINRKPKKLPRMKINTKVDNIFEFEFEDFKLCDYNPHPHIEGKVAV